MGRHQRDPKLSDEAIRWAMVGTGLAIVLIVLAVWWP